MIYANKAFVDLTGYSAAEALGRNCRYLQGPDTDPAAVAAIREAIGACRQAEVELLNYRKDGTSFWNRLQVFPVFDEDGVLLQYVGTQTDVTRLKEAEAERQRLAGELLEVQRLQSLGITIAGLAHDLNTPIGVAVTAASQLSDVVKDAQDRLAGNHLKPEQVSALVEDCTLAARLIGNNLAKAAKLVQSFKETTANATQTEWRRIELRHFLDTLLLSVSPIMRRARCSVTITCREGLSLVTEPGSLAQALSNLLVNATIHAFERQEDRQIAIDVQEDPSELRIVVRDNGRGMTDEAIAKAFTPFFTTRRHAGGSGLGLFSSRRVVRDVLGGELFFESRHGNGTSFTLRLPLVPRDYPLRSAPYAENQTAQAGA
jgi:PAS domain S-box-containing protein